MDSDKHIIYDRHAYFLIGVIAIFYFINNFIWLQMNAYPYGPDEFSHLFISQDFYNSIASGRPDYLINLFKLSVNTIWPPLYHFTSAALCFATGLSGVSALISNFPYLIILLFSVYFIAAKLYSRESGILAVILVSLYPMVFRYSRFFGLDFAQMSVLCLSIYILIRTDNFQNRKFSVLFGIAVGAGLLIKWAFMLFIAGPLACVIVQSIFLAQKRHYRLRTVFTNILLALSVGVLISLSWYLPSHSIMSVRLKMFLRTLAYRPSTAQPVQGIAEALGSDKISNYFLLLVNEQISLLFTIVLILSLPFFCKKRFNRSILISWYFLPYAMLSLSSQQEGRFMLSALPGLALISAVGLQELFSYKPLRHLKHPALILIIFLGLMQFFDVSYNYGRKDKSYPFKTPIGVMHIFYCPLTEQHGWALYGPPFKKDWRMDAISKSIVRSRQTKPMSGYDFLVGMIGEDDYVKQVFYFPKALDYHISRQRPENVFRVVNFLPSPRQDDWSFIEELDYLDYVVFISGDKAWPEYDDFWAALNKFNVKTRALSRLRKDLYNTEGSYDFRDAFVRLSKFLAEKEKNFRLVDEIRLPDGYRAYIYVRSAEAKL